MAAITQRLNQKMAAQIDEARVFVVEPPAIPGYGASAGFEFQLLDQSGGSYSMSEFAGSAGQIIQAANSDPTFARCSPSSSLIHRNSPSMWIAIRMMALGVDFGQAMQTFSIYFGSSYVNDTFQEGQGAPRVCQAAADSRSTQDQLGSIYVKKPLASRFPLGILLGEETIGPSIINRFQPVPLDQDRGLPAQARVLASHHRHSRRVRRSEFPGPRLRLDRHLREEVKAGALAVVIFGMGILVVYLVLPPIESYNDPLIILMTVSTAMLGALVFLSGVGQVSTSTPRLVW